MVHRPEDISTVGWVVVVMGMMDVQDRQVEDMVVGQDMGDMENDPGLAVRAEEGVVDIGSGAVMR